MPPFVLCCGAASWLGVSAHVMGSNPGADSTIITVGPLSKAFNPTRFRDTGRPCSLTLICGSSTVWAVSEAERVQNGTMGFAQTECPGPTDWQFSAFSPSASVPYYLHKSRECLMRLTTGDF